MEIKFFKKEKSFKKESIGLSPNLYWQIAVSLMFVAALGSVFFGYYLFKQTDKGTSDTETQVTSGQVETVKKDRIDAVLQYFSARKITSDKIIGSPALFTDPS